MNPACNHDPYKKLKAKFKNIHEFFWGKPHFSGTFPATAKTERAVFRITKMDDMEHREEFIVMISVKLFNYFISNKISQLIKTGSQVQNIITSSAIGMARTSGSIIHSIPCRYWRTS